MKFSLDKINLDRINIAYKDLTTGNDVKFLLGHFDTRIQDFDMDKMKFTIPKITLAGFDARIIQTPSGSSIAQAAAVDTATKPLNMDLNLGIVDLTKINVYYRSKEMTTTLNLGQFLAEFNKIDLKNQNVDIKNFEINDTKAGLTFAKPQAVQKAVVKTVKKLDTLVSTKQTAKGWTAVLRKISFANNDIKFDNNAQKPIPRGLDYAHMNIHNLNVELENLAYSPDTISGKVNSFTFSEKSGLAIRKFHTAFFYGPKNTRLDDLYLETPQSVIQRKVDIGYQSIATISDHLGDIKINADLDGTRLGLKDVVLLVPSMASMEPFKSSPNEVLKINGKAVGQVNDLRIHGLEVSGLNGVYVKASAVLKGFPDVNKAYFDVDINDFNISRNAINRLAPKGTIPSNISIPEKLNLKGTFKGGMTSFNTNLNLRSSYGNANLIASLKNGDNKKNASYTANLKATNLNMGALLKQPQNVGMITLTADVKGYGLDPKTASVQFNGNVANAYVKGYDYKNIQMKGTGHNGSYVASVKTEDPNIHLSLDAKADMNRKYPAFSATLMVDSIDLQKLNLTKDAFHFHGKIVADIPTADPNYLNADVEATELLFVRNGKRTKIDSISFISTANADSSTISLKAPIVSAHIAGKYKLPEIAPALQDVINKYYNTSLTDTVAKKKPTYSPQQFVFEAHLVKTPWLGQTVPDLKQLDPVSINGSFDSQTGQLVVNGGTQKIVYGTNVIDNMKLAINTGNNALNYSLTVDEIKASSSIDLLFTSVKGKVQDNKLGINLEVQDANKKQRYLIAGVFTVMPNEYQFSFLQNGLVLNYDPWLVSADNALQFGPMGILAHNFAISNNNQVLSINSASQQMNSPLNIDFKNFHIETLTRAAKQDSLQIGGTINGNAQISNLQATAQYHATIQINDFSFKGDTVGNIAVKVNNQTENAIATNVSITGKGNEVNLDGMYYTGTESRFDLNLDIVKLGLKNIEGFSFGSIRSARGSITGKLKITGTTTAPNIRGDINFNKVGFNVSMLNSYFSMPQERIVFNDEGILFDNFNLVDSTGNKAVITGTINTKTYTDFAFNMNIKAKNFRVINSTENDNKLYYGKLFMDADVAIRGDMNTPKVDATLAVNEKTDLTIVLPTSDPSVEDRKGVVEFIDPNAPKTDSILLAKQLDSLKHSSLSGLDVSANIRVNKNANFTIIIDKTNGDVVHLKGEAQLNGGIDPSGKTNLTGTYTVESGSYNLSYATVKRVFLFKKGSTIVWTGDPTSANINLTAIYVAKIPPIDLVSHQLTGTDNQTQYKQKLPFNVELILRNELMKPDISFDIALVDSTYSVSTDVINNINSRLTQIRQDPNELNKQVLGVLVLGRFIGENPFETQGPSMTVEGYVRNSVSSLLADQLNRLAGDLIAGVDLTFGVSSGEDYSTGTAQNRTELSVGLSKQFFNERLTVSVGNDFNLEGNQPGQKSTNIAGNISVNYKLSRDGRYLLRVYSKEQYIVVEGEVIETGVGFSLTIDYNRFKQIFAKTPPAEKAQEKKYKQEQKELEKEEKLKEKNAQTN